MNKIRVTYFALVALLSAVSCTQDAAEPQARDWTAGKIYFRTSIAATRATDMTLENFESFQVTCFNTDDLDNADNTGILNPYFDDATFKQTHSTSANIAYFSSDTQYDWPANDGLLRFFAFSPSCDDMRAGNQDVSVGNNDTYFSLTNNSTGDDAVAHIIYSLERVRVNPDISRQFDFVTAEASGHQWPEFSNGVNLSFFHRMCQIELRAWGANPNYNFEIAGVRLGNPVVEGDFIFADDKEDGASYGGVWAYMSGAPKESVEYIFRGYDGQESKDSGDIIYTINHNTHNTGESAQSIMGLGGEAMVLPTANDKWMGLADPNIAVTPYSTDKMYFSILIRAIDKNTGKTIYPYSVTPENMTVVYYAVDNEGKIISRLYPGESAEGSVATFFKDEERSRPYTLSEGVEIKDFGWAAIPIDVDWIAGKSYVYTLDYSEGIGVHDPADPEPGKPIVGKSSNSVLWGVKIVQWDYAVKNDDYNPDVTVP